MPSHSPDNRAVPISEYDALSAVLADVRERLKKLEQERTDEVLAYESQIAELNGQVQEARLSAKWLRVQNIELEQRLKQQKPEMEKLVDARNTTLRKLNRTRKVIKDLLEERERHSPDDEVANINEIEALCDEIIGQDNESTTTETSNGSIATIRPQLTPSFDVGVAEHSGFIISDNPRDQRSIVASSSQAGLGDEEIFWEGAKADDSPGTGSYPTALTTSSTLSSFKVLVRHYQSRGSADDPWYVHWDRPPGCATSARGVFHWSDLQEYLGLSDDKLSSLQSLQLSPELGLRVEVTSLSKEGAGAFVYNPIFLENNTTTYVLDWGRREDNDRIAQHIEAWQRKNRFFHTFGFPMHPEINGWYYYGAMTWKVKEVPLVWPMLQEDAEALIEQLYVRSHKHYAKGEVVRWLNSGELVQFCVEWKPASSKHTELFAERVFPLPYSGT